MNEKQRAVFAAVLDRVTLQRFGAKKRDAYRTAGVSPATWDRALEGLPLRADRYAAIVGRLFAQSGSDWTTLDVFGGDVPTDRVVVLEDAEVAQLARDIVVHNPSEQSEATSYEGRIIDWALQQLPDGADRDDIARKAWSAILPDLHAVDPNRFPLDLSWVHAQLSAARALLGQDAPGRGPSHVLPSGETEELSDNLIVMSSGRHNSKLAEGSTDDEVQAALSVDPKRKGGLERQADEQDAEAYAPDPEGPEGGA